MRWRTLLKFNLFGCLYGFLLFTFTFMIFRPVQAAAVMHISVQAISNVFIVAAVLSAVIYMYFMFSMARNQPRDWRSTLIFSLYSTLWFPYWLLFVFIAFLVLR
ncbi:hypothetical protein EWI07_07710 [Sporolactobacillus sp. THM7-4]|nr:hypothetical protein EWI07_07710 [Sporolactobacillus sp. THM7-4]